MSLPHVISPKATQPVPIGLKAEQSLLYKPTISEVLLQTQKDNFSPEGHVRSTVVPQYLQKGSCREVMDPSVHLSSCDDTMRVILRDNEWFLAGPLSVWAQGKENTLVVRLTSVWTGHAPYHLKTTVASGVCVELRWRGLYPKSDLNIHVHIFVEQSSFLIL